MRFSCILFLALFPLLLSGCAAAQQNIHPNVVAVEETYLDEDTYPLGLIKPAHGPISSDYGLRMHPLEQRRRLHAGIDIAAERGSDVMAAAKGTVKFRGRIGGYGKVVKIDHGNGWRTMYAHMDKVFVNEGQTLAQGERIGLVGRTGNTTNANLHFELRIHDNPINPVPEGGWVEPVHTIIPVGSVGG